jgi:hypothetical protein
MRGVLKERVRTQRVNPDDEEPEVEEGLPAIHEGT